MHISWATMSSQRIEQRQWMLSRDVNNKERWRETVNTKDNWDPVSGWLALSSIVDPGYGVTTSWDYSERCTWEEGGVVPSRYLGMYVSGKMPGQTVEVWEINMVNSTTLRDCLEQGSSKGTVLAWEWDNFSLCETIMHTTQVPTPEHLCPYQHTYKCLPDTGQAKRKCRKRKRRCLPPTQTKALLWAVWSLVENHWKLQAGVRKDRADQEAQVM